MESFGPRSIRNKIDDKNRRGSRIPRYNITWQRQHKIMHLRSLCNMADRDGLVAMPDVLCDGGVEEVGALRYQETSDVITEVVGLDIAVH